MYGCREGGRVAVSINYFLKGLNWTMHCNYTVLKKSMRLATLPPCSQKVCQIQYKRGPTSGQLTPVRPNELDVVGASGPMPLKSTKSMCTRFLVGTAFEEWNRAVA